MKKKLFTTLACLAMAVVGALGIVGCCDKTPDTITPFSVCKTASIEQVTFTTEDDVKIMSYADFLAEDDPEATPEVPDDQKDMFAKTYVLTGTASKFTTQDQVDAYGDATTEDSYVVLTIGVPAGQSYKVEWTTQGDIENPDFTLSADAKVIDTATDPTNNQLIVKIPESGESVLSVEIAGETYFLFIFAE